VVRRAVVDPLWLPLAVALAVLFAAVGVLGLLAWPLTSRHRVPRLCALALCYLWLDTGLVLGCFGTWLRNPRANRDQARWRAAHRALLLRTLSVLLRTANRLVGLRVVIDGDSLPPPLGRPLIVLARHGGPGDSFVLVDLLLREFGRRPRVVLKHTLQWDPGLDLIVSRLAGCFLPPRTTTGEKRRPELGDLAARLAPDDALLLFPEGANWTPRRLRHTVRHLLQTGRRQEARVARQRATVLPPRPKGTLTCLLARPDADVLIIAHGGLDTLVTPGRLWRALPLHHRPMRVSWWLCPAATVPREPAATERWLQSQWDKVAIRVDALRR
jgi:1-acyl-sn-glycerol-3-phosphate acyltransferase